MMIPLPSGRKVRCESHRRFFLVRDFTAPTTDRKPAVVKRSDSLKAIGAEYRRQLRRNLGYLGLRWFVVDRVTGAVREI